MSDKKSLFTPDKISFVEFRIVKGNVKASEDFDIHAITGYHLNNRIQFGFNLDDKLAKGDIIIEIKTDSKTRNQAEATGSFHLVFIFSVENLNGLVRSN